MTGWTAYQRALTELLTRTPSVLITTHRTASVDIATARACGAPVVAVLRAILRSGGRLRTIDPTTGTLRRQRPAELDSALWGSADCWVGVSAAATESLRQVLPGSACRVTIYNGISPDAPPIRPRTPTLRVGVVARLEPWKRVDRVLAALAQLPDAVQARVKLDVYGEGPEHAALTATAAQLGIVRFVAFHGHRSDWLSRELDVLVCASPDEAFGRTIIEAGLAGIPAIVPTEGGSAELVLPGITGLHFDTDTPDGLAAALSAVADWDSPIAARFSLAARAYARRFDIDCCAAAYAGLISDLLDTRYSQCSAA